MIFFCRTRRSWSPAAASFSLARLALPYPAWLTGVAGQSGTGSQLILDAVTFPEQPQHGMLDGTVSVRTGEEMLVFDPPDLVPHFVVVSGPCTAAVVDGHMCVGRWPGGYLPNEHCEIQVGGAGGALGPCPVFDISNDGCCGRGHDVYDYVALPDGTHYPDHDTGHNHCPSTEVLAAGQTVTWQSADKFQGNDNLEHHMPGTSTVPDPMVGLPSNADVGAGGGWQICFV